jgi:diguanylate cyclase (GGDEF)-like protein
MAMIYSIAEANSWLRKGLMDARVLARSAAARFQTWGAKTTNDWVTHGARAPRALIARLGLITTCITIIAPPLAFLVLALFQLQVRAAEQAKLGARHIEVQLMQHHSADWLNRVSINVLHATQGANSLVVASWLTDKNGTTLMFQGGPAWWPEFKASAPISTPAFEGNFNVALTTRRVMVTSLFVMAAFGFFGLAAYYCFRRLPLAALDDAQQQLQAKQAELLTKKEQLEDQNLRFDAALNNMSQGLCMCDAEQRLVVCNTPYVRMYGLPPDLVAPGTPFAAIIRHRVATGLQAEQAQDDFMRDLQEIIAQQRPVTKMRELSDGRMIAIKHQPMPGRGWLSTHEDMTEYRRIEARVAHMAHHDSLTELPNRVLLRERLERALEGVHKGKGLAVLCLDLDRSKDINDTLGHTVGDALLKAVAGRLSACVGEGDTVARFGGDEFTIVQVAAEQPIAATALTARIMEAIGETFDLDGHQVTIGTSVGIAVAPGDGVDCDQLLKNADLALDRAKREGRGVYSFFEPEMDAHMQARRQLQLDLRKALANGEFELHYQPLVNLEHDEISCLEALLRWRHPDRGMVSPAQFIPLAEETGLIVPIGEWALREACAAAAQWPDPIRVAINLSATQFKSRQLVDTVFSALAAAGLSPRRLELEITESVLLQNNDTTLDILHQLRALGVRIALDDFGTGYSSLSYLRSFPFDKIKIDRCFVSDLTEASEDATAILRAVAGLGTSLGIATTAEGVETQEQLERVREEGCTEMQGYLFSPPRPFKEISRLLHSRAERKETAA